MKLSLLLFASLLMSFSLQTQAAEGVISVKSPYAAKETMDRFVDLAKQKDLKVFARIDHTSGASKVGKTIRPTEVLIFGNPQGGTPFMQCSQTVGIDLPLKALVWKDVSGQVWLGYNDPEYIALRHNIVECPVVDGLSQVLSGLAGKTVAH